MIAVRTDDSFLRIADIERAFSKLLADGDKWKVYPDINSMLEDKDKINIIFNEGRIEGSDIEQFTKLDWIFSYSAGVDNYPLEELDRMGVVLTNASGVHAKNMAEQVLGVMIMFSRDLFTAYKNQEKKLYDKDLDIGELTGKNLLINGTGSIGREIARKAKALDMNITGIRSHPDGNIPENFDAIDSEDNLDKYLATCDYLISVVPSTDKTRGLFNKEKFALMNPNSVFINLGRGDLIVEEDLVHALKEKTIKGAYLDVLPEEPLPSDSQLWDLDGLFITPHSSGSTPNYFARAMDIFSENIKRYRNGQELINKINYRDKY